jgi:propionaldehyde dehydrogenase
MTIDPKQVELIVEKVLEGLSAADQNLSRHNSHPGGSDGVFEDMEDAIQAAVVAHQELVRLPLATREKIVQAIRNVGWANRQEYGRMELEETDLGAVAVGVIASVNAITNAAPGIIHNGIMMVAGGNTVVHNPHPKTKVISARVIKDVNKAVIAVSGPPNCMTTVSEPDIPTAQNLMTHPKIDMISVTGGHRVVEFATKTGKRVIAGGPGNPPVVVDDSADLDSAAQCIIRGASFSNCTPCSSEKEIFVVDSVADRLKELLIKYGAFELSVEQEEALVKEIFKEIRPGRVPSVINMEYIGKPPSVILKDAIGLDVPPDTKIAILETDKEHPLIWTEQIMPVLPFVRCRDAKEAMIMGVAAEQGLRHTIVFHSNDLQNLAYMSSIADASQFVKNASSIGGLGVEGEGFKSLHISTGGEGLARPRTYTLVRRCVLTDDFRYRFGIESDRPHQQ